MEQHPTLDNYIFSFSRVQRIIVGISVLLLVGSMLAACATAQQEDTNIAVDSETLDPAASTNEGLDDPTLDDELPDNALDAVPNELETPEPNEVDSPQFGPTPDPAAATVGDINDDSEGYRGDQVSVVGNITEVLNERIFRLQDPGIVNTDDVLVVFSESTVLVNEGNMVLIRGVVRDFDPEGVQEYAGAGLLDDLFGGYDPAVVIYAESIENAPGTATSPITINEIFEAPMAYIGQPVNLTGVVSNVYSDQVFQLEDENMLTNAAIIVIFRDAASDLTFTVGLDMVVEGHVTTLAEAESALDGDMPDEVPVDYQNFPVILADTITPGAD
ncbi:MAG: hypothetical protein HC914_08755 [Chloroflexaceae bacterium]|nr:hypothetical protein [Chloroflexaceae bacterium]